MEEHIREKIVRAGFNYKKVYGVFPKWIGVCYKYAENRQYIAFPVLPENVSRFQFNIEDIGNIYVQTHTTHILPIMNVEDENEVYLDMPELGNSGKLRNGEALARMAKSEYKVLPFIY